MLDMREEGGGPNPLRVESLITTTWEDRNEKEAAENTATAGHQHHTVDRHSSGLAGDLHDYQPDGAGGSGRRNSATAPTGTGTAPRERDCVEYGPKRHHQDQSA